LDVTTFPTASMGEIDALQLLSRCCERIALSKQAISTIFFAQTAPSASLQLSHHRHHLNVFFNPASRP
jgi:hypothetical protein